MCLVTEEASTRTHRHTMSRFLSCRRYSTVEDRAYSGQAMGREGGYGGSMWASLTDLARRIPLLQLHVLYAVPRVHVSTSGMPGQDRL
jgi:hypothetical protein